MLYTYILSFNKYDTEINWMDPKKLLIWKNKMQGRTSMSKRKVGWLEKTHHHVAKKERQTVTSKQNLSTKAASLSSHVTVDIPRCFYALTRLHFPNASHLFIGVVTHLPLPTTPSQLTKIPSSISFIFIFTFKPLFCFPRKRSKS